MNKRILEWVGVGVAFAAGLAVGYAVGTTDCDCYYDDEDEEDIDSMYDEEIAREFD